MIKYQGTALDILLVQEDGWKWENKVGCVCSLSVRLLLPFFLPLLCEKCVLGKKKEEERNVMDFTVRKCREGNIYLRVWYLMLPLSPVSPL